MFSNKTAKAFQYPIGFSIQTATSDGSLFKYLFGNTNETFLQNIWEG